MEQQTDHTSGAGHREATSTRGFKDEILGPPRPTVRAQVFASIFALGTIISIALAGYLDSPGQSLIYSGITAMGAAELLDPRLRRFAVTLRIIGPLIALGGVISILI